MTNEISHTISQLTVNDITELAFLVPFSICLGIGAGIFILGLFGITFGKED
jgi:hypothetical protein